MSTACLALPDISALYTLPPAVIALLCNCIISHRLRFAITASTAQQNEDHGMRTPFIRFHCPYSWQHLIALCIPHKSAILLFSTIFPFKISLLDLACSLRVRDCRLSMEVWGNWSWFAPNDPVCACVINSCRSRMCQQWNTEVCVM
jgi:hypothetical protein